MQARVRAAMAFADIGREALAPLVGVTSKNPRGVSPSTIDRYSGPKKKPPVRPRREYLEDIAAACGFTVDFFYADLVSMGLRVPVTARAATPPALPAPLGGSAGRGRETEAG